VVEEDVPVFGKDFFDPGRQEKLCDTPAAIARVIRGRKYVRRMVVSAADSFDVNKKPLKYHWVVLRGDLRRVEIEKLNDAGSIAELRIPYHERRKVDAAGGLESNRVDIGAFVHNGTYYSAPGFITFLSLDSEARTYAKKGRLVEIGYDAGETDLRVSDWIALFHLLKGKPSSLGFELLKKQFTPPEFAAVHEAGQQYRPAHAKQEAARQKTAKAEMARNKADADLKIATAKREAAVKAHAQRPSDKTRAALKRTDADLAAAAMVRKAAEVALQAAHKEAETAHKQAEEILNQKCRGLNAAVRERVQRALDKIKNDPTLFVENQKAIQALAAKSGPASSARFVAAVKSLISFGLLKKQGMTITLQTLRPGSAPLADRLTPYERILLERFHADMLSALLYQGCLSASPQVNFVDQRISTPKAWRDVYHYDSKGNMRGWIRCDGNHSQEFNLDGHVVLKKDALGRAIKARTVKYEYQPSARQVGVPGIKEVWGKQIVYYEYKDANDLTGHVKKREDASSDK
jgi:hypothetical protein